MLLQLPTNQVVFEPGMYVNELSEMVQIHVLRQQACEDYLAGRISVGDYCEFLADSGLDPMAILADLDKLGFNP